MVENQWEARGRAVKGYKIARVLLRLLEAGTTAEEIETMSDSLRERAARLAGVKPPSRQTWEIATALAATMESDPPPQPRGCTYCHGPLLTSGEADRHAHDRCEARWVEENGREWGM